MRICDPVCDFCKFYEFNPAPNGAYTGDGQCKHSEHPRQSEPWQGCDDFSCDCCDDGTHEFL